MTYRAVIFDVDGTLLDTTGGITASLHHLIETEGLQPLEEEVLRSFIGPPIQDSLVRVYGYNHSEAMRLAEIFRAHYKDVSLFDASVYGGIFDVTKELLNRGTTMATATYKRQDYAKELLESFGFQKYCSVMRGSDFEGKLTKTDIIEECLVELDIDDPSGVLMVGDSHHDAIGAQRVGVDFLAVTYGFGFKTDEEARRHPCIGIAHSPCEILKYV